MEVFVVVWSCQESLGAIGSHWESLGAVGVNYVSLPNQSTWLQQEVVRVAKHELAPHLTREHMVHMLKGVGGCNM